MLNLNPNLKCLFNSFPVAKEDVSSSFSSLNTSLGNLKLDTKMPIMCEDYVDIGLGEEEEDNDYSQPAVRNYELDRSQITLNEIIGVGQFGDVHIGTFRTPLITKGAQSDSESFSQKSENDIISTNENDAEKNIFQSVAVKTCKADADLITSEKFLEEACKLFWKEKSCLVSF